MIDAVYTISLEDNWFHTTCKHTRVILPCNDNIDLNKLSPGPEWTPFLHSDHDIQQVNHRRGPCLQDSSRYVYMAPYAQDSSHRAYVPARVDSSLVSFCRGRTQ